ncbi:MAG: FCD domain-containing protein [Desulfobulbaceae bacterium]|nr:FCD domain-containing protein [Desulfobulbaceae bacterium]
MTQNSLSKERQKHANPIPGSTEIDRLRQTIGSNTRDLLLFDLAIETGVTANQLLTLHVKDLVNLNVGEEISLLRRRHGHNVPVTVGPHSHKSFQRYLIQNNPPEDDLLFKSRKGNGSLALPSASRLVSGWFKRVGLKGMSGFLSLRKTWESQHKLSEIRENKEPSPSIFEPGYSANSIQTPTTQELVYRELEHAIVTARIKPGERLITETLAKQMGISRIPVREAIGRLAARNLLIVHPQKGTTVYGLSEKKLKEILEIRLMIELTAARKATLAAGKNSIETLKGINNQYIEAQKTNDADKILSANRKFHFTIYSNADMPILLSMIKSLWDQASPYYHLMFRQTVSHDPRTGGEYHRKIIDAISENDPEKVSKWLKTDLLASTEFVLGVMRSIKTAE